ncbi:MAG: transposase [Caulobacterales bacterium 68-7]|nr:MAG: transposase [Caulobacterales bacterium 68-7]
MSINSAMLAGVSGLMANSSALAAISDNIANVNTVGYKRNAANFSTLVTAQGHGTSYSAGGVHAQTRQYVTQQGLTQATSSSLDLAINGSGFFVATDKPENIEDSDARSFTRAGSFQLDSLGYLKNDAGLYLQGWPVNADGEILPDPSDLSRLKSINVASVGGTAEPTTRASLTANLKSSTPVSQAVQDMAVTPTPPATAYNAASNSMADYDADAGTGVKPDFEVQVPVSDSKGGKHTLVVSFLKSATPNEWYAEVRADPASDVTLGSGGTNGLIKSGTVTFTSDGQFDSTTLFGPGGSLVSIGASSDTPAAGEVSWAPGLGISAQDIQLSLSEGAGGLTQADSASVVQAVTTNGTAFGTLTNVEIDPDGFVTAVFDNGVTRRIAQVAVATFANPNGLIALSGNSYRVSQQSGPFSLKAAGTGGAGEIAPSTLESSTVDLSTEFTGLIVTQRAYSASSKIITTADQMLEELINIKR